jgi:hypothetical protein
VLVVTPTRERPQRAAPGFRRTLPLMNRVLHRVAGDAILLLHFAFVLFAVFGGLLILVNSGWAWVHVPAVLWSSVVNLAGWTCPLTPLEKGCRKRVGEAYDGGFVEHYVGSLVYPRGMPRQLELVAGVSILSWNALLYVLLIALR